MVKFIDEAKIFVKSGRGGKGCVSFRREKYVPRGGPDGGDGGDGGDVILVAKENKTSLLDHRYNQHYKAKNGGHGTGKNKNGKNGQPIYIPVPVGTTVKDFYGDHIIGDLIENDQELVVAHGGKGGRGNARFATPTIRAPRRAEDGKDGEETVLKLELKLLADVGIIGFPNAGKSTLISRISAAKPKIADYPFTTLIPNLGVVSYDDGKSFVVADIPGLIEGAHSGTGLGTDFLRHIERTKLLIHLIDVSPAVKRSPLEDYKVMNHELEAYSYELGEKPQIVAINKIDLVEAYGGIEKIKNDFSKLEIDVFPVSSVTGKGIKELISKTIKVLREIQGN